MLIYVLPVFVQELLERTRTRKQWKSDCFLSHAWDNDSTGRNNHERVLQVHAALSAAGVKSWVDKENLDSDLNNEMSNGIDRSRLVIVFITRAYIDKVQGYGPRGLDDNCKAEFEYSLRRHGTRRMVVVVMDPSCVDTSTWTGGVGFRLGSQIYHNLSDDPVNGQALASLVGAIYRRLGAGRECTVMEETSEAHESPRASELEASIAETRASEDTSAFPLNRLSSASL
jgi:hypothetical protein